MEITIWEDYGCAVQPPLAFQQDGNLKKELGVGTAQICGVSSAFVYTAKIF